jgi:hypothetical protein
VETTLVPVLLKNFAYVALQISHVLPPYGGIQRNSAAAITAQQTLTQDFRAGPSVPPGRDTATAEITDSTLRACVCDGKREIPMTPIKK